MSSLTYSDLTTLVPVTLPAYNHTSGWPHRCTIRAFSWLVIASTPLPLPQSVRSGSFGSVVEVNQFVIYVMRSEKLNMLIGAKLQPRQRCSFCCRSSILIPLNNMLSVLMHWFSSPNDNCQFTVNKSTMKEIILQDNTQSIDMTANSYGIWPPLENHFDLCDFIRYVKH